MATKLNKSNIKLLNTDLNTSIANTPVYVASLGNINGVINKSSLINGQNLSLSNINRQTVPSISSIVANINNDKLTKTNKYAVGDIADVNLEAIKITPNNIGQTASREVISGLIGTPESNIPVSSHAAMRINKNYNCVHNYFSFLEDSNYIPDKVKDVTRRVETVKLYDDLIDFHENELLSHIISDSKLVVKKLENHSKEIYVDWNIKSTENWGEVTSDITINDTNIYFSSQKPFDNQNVNIFLSDSAHPLFTVNFDGSFLLNTSLNQLDFALYKKNSIKFESSYDPNISETVIAYQYAYNMLLLSNKKSIGLAPNISVNDISQITVNPIYNTRMSNIGTEGVGVYEAITYNDRTETTSKIWILKDKTYAPNSRMFSYMFLCSDINDINVLSALDSGTYYEPIFYDAQDDNKFIIPIKWESAASRNRKIYASLNNTFDLLTLHFKGSSGKSSIPEVLKAYFDKIGFNWQGKRGKIYDGIDNIDKPNSNNFGFVIKFVSSDNKLCSFIKLKLINEKHLSDYTVDYNVELMYDTYNVHIKTTNEAGEEIEEQVEKIYPLKYYKITLQDSDNNPVLFYAASPSSKNTGNDKPKIKLSPNRKELYVFPYGIKEKSKKHIVNIYYANRSKGGIESVELELDPIYFASIPSTDESLQNIKLDLNTFEEESIINNEIITKKINLFEYYDDKYYLPQYTSVEYDHDNAKINSLNVACISSLKFNNFDNFDNFSFGTIELKLNKESFYHIYSNYVYGDKINVPLKIKTVRDNDILYNELNIPILLSTNNSLLTPTSCKIVAYDDLLNEHIFIFYEETEDGEYIFTSEGGGKITVFKSSCNILNVENYSTLNKDHILSSTEYIEYRLVFNTDNSSSVSVILDDEDTPSTTNEEEQNITVHVLTDKFYKPLTKKKKDILNTTFDIRLFKNDKQLNISKPISVKTNLFDIQSHDDEWILKIENYVNSTNKLELNPVETTSKYSLSGGIGISGGIGVRRKKFVLNRIYNLNQYKVSLIPNTTLKYKVKTTKNVELYISDIAGYNVTLNFDIIYKQIVSDPYDTFEITELRTQDETNPKLQEYYTIKLNSVTGFVDNELFDVQFDYNNIIIYGHNTSYSLKLTFNYVTADEIDENYLCKEPLNRPLSDTHKEYEFDIQYEKDTSFKNFKMPFLQQIMDEWEKTSALNKNSVYVNKLQKFFAFNSGADLIKIENENSAEEIYEALSRENISEINSIKFYTGRIMPRILKRSEFINTLDKSISLLEKVDNVDKEIEDVETRFSKFKLAIDLQEETDINGKLVGLKFTPNKNIVSFDRTKVTRIQQVISKISLRKIEELEVKDISSKANEPETIEEAKPTQLDLLKEKICTLGGIKDIIYNLSDDDYEEVINTIDRDDEAKVGDPEIVVTFTHNTSGLSLETIDYIKDLKIKSLNDWGNYLTGQSIPSELQKMWNNDWLYKKQTNLFGTELKWNSSYSVGLMNNDYLMWNLNDNSNDGTDTFTYIKTLTRGIWPSSSYLNGAVETDEMFIDRYKFLYPYYSFIPNTKKYIGSLFNNVFFDYLSNIYNDNHNVSHITLSDITSKYNVKFMGDVDEFEFQSILQSYMSKSYLLFDYTIFNELTPEGYNGDTTHKYLTDVFRNANITYTQKFPMISYWEIYKDDIKSIYYDNLTRYEGIRESFLDFTNINEGLIKNDLFEYSKYVLDQFDPDKEYFDKAFLNEGIKPYFIDNNENEVKINPNNNVDKRKEMLNLLVSETIYGQRNYFPEMNSYIYNVIYNNGIFNYPEEILTQSKLDIDKKGNIIENDEANGDVFNYVYDEYGNIIGISKEFTQHRQFRNTVIKGSYTNELTYYIGSFNNDCVYSYVCKTGEKPVWNSYLNTYSALRVSPTGKIIKYKYDGNNLDKYNNYYSTYTTENEEEYITLSIKPSVKYKNVIDGEDYFEVKSISIDFYSYDEEEGIYVLDETKLFENSYIYFKDSTPNPVYETIKVYDTDGIKVDKQKLKYFDAFSLNADGKIINFRYNYDDFKLGIYDNKFKTVYEKEIYSYITYPSNTAHYNYIFNGNDDKYFIHKYTDKINDNVVTFSYLYKMKEIDLKRLIDIHTSCIQLHLLNLEKNAEIISILDDMHDINVAKSSESKYTYTLTNCYTNTYVLFNDTSYVDVNMDYTYVDKFTGYTYNSYNESLRIDIPTNTYVIPSNYVTKVPDPNKVFWDGLWEVDGEWIKETVSDTSHYGNNDYQSSYIYEYLWKNSKIDFEIKLPTIKTNDNTTISIKEFLDPNDVTYHTYTYSYTSYISVNHKYTYIDNNGDSHEGMHEFGIGLHNAPCGRVAWSYIDNEELLDIENLTSYTDIQTFDDIDFRGAKNTTYILNKVHSKILSDAPAARVANDYLMEGKSNIIHQPFKYYLGDVSEWQIVTDNIRVINSYISELGGDVFYDGNPAYSYDNNKWFWTSSEIDGDCAWTTSFTEYSIKTTSKHLPYYVRPFFKINPIYQSNKYETILFKVKEIIKDEETNDFVPFVPFKLQNVTIDNNLFDDDKNKPTDDDIKIIKSMTSMYVALFMFVIEPDVYTNSQKEIIVNDLTNETENWSTDNIDEHLDNIDEFIQYYENISSYKKITIIPYDDLIYNRGDKRSETKAKHIKIEIPDRDKGKQYKIVVIPIYIYTSLSSSIIDTKYNYMVASPIAKTSDTHEIESLRVQQMINDNNIVIEGAKYKTAFEQLFVITTNDLSINSPDYEYVQKQNDIVIEFKEFKQIPLYTAKFKFGGYYSTMIGLPEFESQVNRIVNPPNKRPPRR